MEQQVAPLPVIVETPEGKRVEVPIDRNAIGELDRAFSGLSTVKQEWLLARFPFSDTDEEATESVRSKGRDLLHSTVKGWKQKDVEFMRAYGLLAGRCIDWATYITMSVEAGNALLGAIASRELLKKPWEGLSAREATAKMQAAQASLDRVLGNKHEVNVRVIPVESIVPRR